MCALRRNWIFKKWVLLLIFSFLLSPSFVFSAVCVWLCSCPEKGEGAARIPVLILQNTWAFSSHKFRFLELGSPCWRSFIRRSFVLWQEKELLLLPGCALVLAKGHGSAGSSCAQGILGKVQEIAELSSFGGAQGCVWGRAHHWVQSGTSREQN